MGSRHELEITNYTTTLQGGEATREEMCLSFAVYYPRVPLTVCISAPGNTTFNQFVGQFVAPE